MVKKVNAIDTSGLVKRTDYNAKIKDIEEKVPDITNLATTAALTAAEDKNLQFSDLAKKEGYDAKISETEIKYFTTYDHNKFAKGILDTNIIIWKDKENKKLINESGLGEKIRTFATKKEIKTWATKAELKQRKIK